MTAEEAFAEVGQVNERLRELEEKLRQATSDPISEAVPQLRQEIAEATARKEWLLGQIPALGEGRAANNLRMASNGGQDGGLIVGGLPGFCLLLGFWPQHAQLSRSPTTQRTRT